MTARQELNRQLARSIHEGDGLPTESDSALNDAARAVIAELRDEHGECWLGDVNARESGAVMWQWDGGLVYNFGADFVLPAFDNDLATLIAEYRARDWKTIADRDWIAARVVAIFDRVEKLGGVALVWS